MSCGPGRRGTRSSSPRLPGGRRTLPRQVCAGFPWLLRTERIVRPIRARLRLVAALAGPEARPRWNHVAAGLGVSSRLGADDPALPEVPHLYDSAGAVDPVGVNAGACRRNGHQARPVFRLDLHWNRRLPALAGAVRARLATHAEGAKPERINVLRRIGDSIQIDVDTRFQAEWIGLCIPPHAAGIPPVHVIVQPGIVL